MAAPMPEHAGLCSNKVAHYVAQSRFKSKMHGPESFIAVSDASYVSTVKDSSTDRWKSMWNEPKDCLRMKECVGWTSSRLTLRLLHLKRPQLDKVVQVLTGTAIFRDTRKIQAVLNLLCVQNVA